MAESVPTQLEQNIVNTNLAVKSLINVSIRYQLHETGMLRTVLSPHSILLFQDIKQYNGSMEDLKKLYDFGRTKTSNWRELIDELETKAREETDEATKHKLFQVVKTEKDQLYR